MLNEWISLGVFVVVYALFVVLPHKRSWVAIGGSIILILTQVVPIKIAILEKVNWNVMGLFFGTLILAEMFLMSKVPAVIAEWLVDKMKTGMGAMLILCLLAGVISAFVENVAVVLLVAPVAFSVAERLKTSPVPLLIGIAISSNLQGTATMIGDPPSMILAGYMKMGFMDFFTLHGKPGIFFAVEIGAIASLFVLAWVFRKEKATVGTVAIEKPRSMVPSYLLGMLVICLSISTLFDPEFKWFAGVVTLGLAAIALIWYQFIAKWGNIKEMATSLDWDTTLFLIGVFIVVGGLSDAGWLTRLSDWLASTIGSNPLLTFVIIVTMSMLISAFVDNVPFLLAMIPVVQQVATQTNGPETALMYGLLIGACLGGNITPLGASANVVTLGLLKKNGHIVNFRQFMSIGIPFTLAAVLASSTFVWLVWGKTY